MKITEDSTVCNLAQAAPRFYPEIQPGNKSPVLASSWDLCGVEIELENFVNGPRAKMINMLNLWDEHVEGSLVNGKEFVLDPPLNGKNLDEGINAFFDSGVQYTGGERTSVHIHVDMLDGTTVGQLRNMTVLTYLIEGAVYRTADENRKWASYSCPLTDMDPQRLGRVLTSDERAYIQAGLSGKFHEDKYYGLNLASVCKHGTVEFRYFPCTDQKEVLYQWLNLVLEIKSAAKCFASPTRLLDKFSNIEAIDKFIRNRMPHSADSLLMYLDRPDVMDRVKFLRAILADKGFAEGPTKLPKHYGESKSLKKAVKKLLAAANAKQDVDEDENAVRDGIWAAENPFNVAQLAVGENGEALLGPAGPAPQPGPPMPIVNEVAAVADIVGPDGVINEVAFNDLLGAIRLRVDAVQRLR